MYVTISERLDYWPEQSANQHNDHDMTADQQQYEVVAFCNSSSYKNGGGDAYN